MADEGKNSQFAAAVLESCVNHGRLMLASQVPFVERQGLDLMSELKDMPIHLYLAGVMWRFGEQFDLPGPRDRGFIRLLSMLVADGMPYKKAEERIAQLLRLSRTADGRDNRTIAAGYSAAEGDGSLAALLSLFKNNPKALAAPYRVLTLGNTIGAILGVSALAIAMFAGRSWEFALGIGTVVGLATLGITFAIHKHMLKSKG